MNKSAAKAEFQTDCDFVGVIPKENVSAELDLDFYTNGQIYPMIRLTRYGNIKLIKFDALDTKEIPHTSIDLRAALDDFPEKSAKALLMSLFLASFKSVEGCVEGSNEEEDMTFRCIIWMNENQILEQSPYEGVKYLPYGSVSEFFDFEHCAK
jgi:hypothetical protein